MARQEQSTALSTEILPPRLPYPPQLEAAGFTPGKWKALVDAIFPSARTVDGVVLALEYCRSRNLDPFKRVVHVVPMWNTKLGREVETVWPGIGEQRTTAHRTGKMAGVDDCVFGPTKKQKFEDSKERDGRNGKYVERLEAEVEFPQWAQVTVYRIVDGQRCAFVGPKTRFVETFSGAKGLKVPNERWTRAPFQMLEKCAEAAALRRAFPEELGDVATAEEMEGKIVDAIDVDYAVVEPDQAQDPQPERERLPWSKEIDDELKRIQGRLDRTHAPDVLVGARDQELEQRKDWPEAARRELARRFDDRLAFLEEGKPSEPEPEAQQEAPAESESTPSLEQIRKYLLTFERALGERIGNAPNLNSYKAGEEKVLASLPKPYHASAMQAFALAMHMTRESQGPDDWPGALAALRSGNAGDAAAGPDDTPSGEKESA